MEFWDYIAFRSADSGFCMSQVGVGGPQGGILVAFRSADSGFCMSQVGVRGYIYCFCDSYFCT